MSEIAKGLLLIGIGGGGCHFASHAANRFGPGIQAIGFDTDLMTARTLNGIRCKVLGASRFDGCGTGGDVVKGRTAVQDDVQAIIDATQSAHLAIVVTSLGGGFGSGATPGILHILRQRGITTVCLATLPFSLEGKDREACAARAVPLLEEETDALVLLHLDDLYGDTAAATHGLGDMIPVAEAKLGDAITLVWSLLLTPGFIGFDSEDLLGIIRQSGGHCRFAVADASGEARAVESVNKLCRSPMLGSAPLSDAKMAVLGVLAGTDLRLSELGEISETFRLATAQNCEFHLGTVLDERYAGTVKLVGLFFDAVRQPETDETPIDISLTGAVSRKSRSRRKTDSKLALGATGFDRFRGADATYANGVDLDRPTYLRRGLQLDR